MPKKATNKTQPTDSDVVEWIENHTDERRRQECRTLLELFRSATGHEAKLWGTAIIGFGEYHYRYASGREGDSFIAGFSPRKAAISVYLLPGLDCFTDLIADLGRITAGKSCINIKKLEDIDLDVLAQLATAACERLANGELIIE